MYRHVVVFTAFIALLLLLANYFTGGLFYVNKTISAPRGIYMAKWNDGWNYNDFVLMITNQDYGKYKAGYKMLKHVRGMQGDTYTVEENQLIMNGNKYPIYHVKQIPQLPKGTYVIPAHKYMMMNDPKRSFDSRYIGLIDESQLKRELVLFYSYEPVYELSEKWEKFDITVWIRTLLGK